MHTPVFSYPDQLEFESLYEEIFKEHTYYVDLPTQTPLIIDCGAHIGLTTLYLHKQYPQATFICIEPNPRNLTYLSKNLEQNNVSNVTIIPKALVTMPNITHTRLYVDQKWGVFSSLRRGGWTADRDLQPIDVEAVTLAEVINVQSRPVDVLKVDIEGMETEVLIAAGDAMRKVSHCLLEFHQTKDHRPERLLKFLGKYFSSIEVTQDRRKEKKRTDQLLFIQCAA